MKFVAVENGRNPEKNVPRPRIIHCETHREFTRRELGGGMSASNLGTAKHSIAIYLSITILYWSI